MTLKSVLVSLLFGFNAYCSLNAYGDETNISNIDINQKPNEITSGYDQIFTLQIGRFAPDSLQLDNGTYTFTYGNSEVDPVSSFLGELGWAPKLLSFAGAFYLEENLCFSIFHGGAGQSAELPPLSNATYSLLLFGFDTRLMYAATWFPIRRLIPFADGGYQYTIYYQPGSSGFESAQGGVGNLAAGAGLRVWLNPASSMAGFPPFFISAKVNRIFPASNGVNLGSTSFLGGVSIGL